MLVEQEGGGGGGGNSILACAMQVSGAQSSLRTLQAGRPYQAPPSMQGLPPDSLPAAGGLQVRRRATQGFAMGERQRCLTP